LSACFPPCVFSGTKMAILRFSTAWAPLCQSGSSLCFAMMKLAENLSLMHPIPAMSAYQWAQPPSLLIPDCHPRSRHHAMHIQGACLLKCHPDDNATSSTQE